MRVEVKERNERKRERIKINLKDKPEKKKDL